MPLPHDGECLRECRQVLARLVRSDGEDVRATQVGPLAVRSEARVDSGRSDDYPVFRDAEQLDDLAAREPRVDEDSVAGLRRVDVLRPVHSQRRRLDPVREAERDEVVDRRRAQAGALRGVHPVREVEDVERAEKPLDGQPSESAPCGAPGVGTGQQRQAQLDGQPIERGANQLTSPRPRRPEPNQLVPVLARLGEPSQHPAEVVTDSRSRTAKRRDVDNNSHKKG
jgi:hypothetical protein